MAVGGECELPVERVSLSASQLVSLSASQLVS